MRIEQLYQFIEVVKAGSINNAAAKLYMAQSSLSKSVRLLEKEINALLLIRSPRGIALTDFGKEFFDYAVKLCTDYNYICSLAERNIEENPKLGIAAPQLQYVEDTFISFYKKYAQQNPAFTFRQGSLTQNIADVQGGLCDIGISLFPSESINLNVHLLHNAGMEYIPITRFDARVILRNGHPLLKEHPPSVSLRELENYPLATGHSCYTPHNWESLLGYTPASPNSIWLSQRECLGNLIAKTDIYAVIAYHPLAYPETPPYDSNRITMLPIVESGLYFKLGWFAKKAAVLPSWAREFIDALQSPFQICDTR